MTNLMKFHSADLPALIERINKYSIGMEDYFDRLGTLHETTTNYPPYNLIQVSNVESRLELALAGFRKKEVNVYTQDGKLFVEGQKEDKETDTTYVHRGVAQRSFTRSWTLSDETEIRSVVFEDGLLSITLGKIVQKCIIVIQYNIDSYVQHHKRKEWF